MRTTSPPLSPAKTLLSQGTVQPATIPELTLSCLQWTSSPLQVISAPDYASGSSSTALVSICRVYWTLFGFRFWECGGICLTWVCWVNHSLALMRSVIKGNPSLSACVFWCASVYVWGFVFVCVISSFRWRRKLRGDVPLWFCAFFSWLRSNK